MYFMDRAAFAFGRRLHAFSMWQGVPQLVHLLVYAMHTVPVRRCASNPQEWHLPIGGQQLLVINDPVFASLLP